MAINKVYTCDICGDEIPKENRDGDCVRLKWTDPTVPFVLTGPYDNTASENIICRRCLIALREAKLPAGIKVF